MAGQRLLAIMREFNVGMTTLVEFLHKKGFPDIVEHPSTKVSDEMYTVIRKEFKSDYSAKAESEQVSISRHNKDKNRGSVKLEEPQHEKVLLEEKKEPTKIVEEIKTVIPDDIKPKFKIIDKIDLNPRPKPRDEGKQQPIEPAPVAEASNKSDDNKPKEIAKEQKPDVIIPEPQKVVVAEIVETPKVEVIRKPEEAKPEKVEPQTIETPVNKPSAPIETVHNVKTEAAKPEILPEQKIKIEQPRQPIVVKKAKPIERIKDEPEVSITDIIDIIPPSLNVAKTEVFAPSKAAFKSNIKVVDKIDLDLINQRTRPPKKSKEEKRKERERNDRRKPNTPNGPIAGATAAPIGDGNPAIPPVRREPIKVIKAGAPGSRTEDPNRQKRKRIFKENERVVIDPKTPQGAQGQAGGHHRPANTPSQNPNANANQPPRKKVIVKRAVKPEVNDADISKQVKDTLARLVSKGKSNSSRHRRDKRSSYNDRQQAEMDRSQSEHNILKLTEFVTLSDLASMMNMQPTQLIGFCLSLGIFVSINQRLDAETIALITDEFNYKVEFVSVEVQEAITVEYDDEDQRKPRSPIVTVMGHVDHGKTSLLDYVRSANVIAGEAGGITQHIGAYHVTLDDGRTITFLDTPGHEAFTAMRARGAKVTDVAIIVVSADDSVMPQTVEAINHASAAGVPIVFAINKVDKPNANVERIKEQLANMNYLVEDWGGKYQSHEISAKFGTGVNDLLDKVLLEAELLDLKANPNRLASGSVVESSLDKGRGYVATILVQNGTLRVGDVVLAGPHFGHVKAMFNERNQRIKVAGPSEPVLILGLSGAPQAGDYFNVMESEKEAREIANKRSQLQREQGIRTKKHITLDEIGRRIAIGNFQELNIIIKGDVDGSIEALADSLIKLSTPEIQVNVIHKAVGQISESDIMLAAASNAIVVGFQVRPSLSARRIAEKEDIDIRLYSIIYDATNEIKAAMEGMLSPDIKEEITATVEVREVFKITKVGTIAGCLVREGKLKRNAKVRLIRDGIVVYSGELESLKRFKDDVKEVSTGYECGCNIRNFNDIKEGDTIEAYEQVEVKKTL